MFSHLYNTLLQCIAARVREDILPTQFAGLQQGQSAFATFCSNVNHSEHSSTHVVRLLCLGHPRNTGTYCGDGCSGGPVASAPLVDPSSSGSGASAADHREVNDQLHGGTHSPPVPLSSLLKVSPCAGRRIHAHHAPMQSQDRVKQAEPQSNTSFRVTVANDTFNRWHSGATMHLMLPTLSELACPDISTATLQWTESLLAERKTIADSRPVM